MINFHKVFFNTPLVLTAVSRNKISAYFDVQVCTCSKTYETNNMAFGEFVCIYDDFDSLLVFEKAQRFHCKGLVM